MSDDKLKKEVAFYEVHREEYLDRYRDRFVVIHGERLQGDFKTFAEAYEFALNEFGDVPLLIQRVQESEDNQAAPAMTLGILRAHVS